MSTVLPAAPLPAPTGLTWYVDGFRLLCRAPLRLIGAFAVLIGIEMLIQLAVPFVGMPLSKLVVAALGGVLFLLLDSVDRTGLLAIRAALRIARDNGIALLGVATVALLVFATQVAAATALLGEPGLRLLLLNDTTAIDPALLEARFGLVLAAGIPLATLFALVAPLVVMERRRAPDAVRTSVALVVRHWRAVAAYTLPVIVLLVVSPMATLLAFPVLMTSQLAMYRALRGCAV